MARIIDIEVSEQRVCIIFPYDRKLLPVVRALPGRWFDPKTKNWYAPLEHATEVVGRLTAHHFKLSITLREYFEESGQSFEPAGATGGSALTGGPLPVPADTYSISHLNEEARYALRQAFSDEVWVVGEVQNYDKNRPGGHAYFELVERLAPDEDPIARIRVVLFREHRNKVERALMSAVEPIRLRDGLAVRFKARVDLYTASGSFQLIAQEVDPAYTSGELHQNRERILKILEAEGIREQNQLLKWPSCPLRVGLITSAGSDAYNDFLHELERSGFGFKLGAHHARVQGAQTEPSVLRALDYFARNAADYDVLAIVRGGGSRSDLAYFDTEAIARAVSQHPLKVVVGVGHQRDQCVLDFVAESQKTPTAAAQTLVGRVQAYLEATSELFEQIAAGAQAASAREFERLRGGSIRLERAVDAKVRVESRRFVRLRSALLLASRDALARSERRVDRLDDAVALAAQTRLNRQAQKLEFLRTHLQAGRLERHFSAQSQRLSAVQQRFERAARRAFADERGRVDNLSERLRLLDPQRILERGFSILSTDEGVVRAPEDVAVGQKLRARLAAGQIIVRREAEGE